MEQKGGRGLPRVLVLSWVAKLGRTHVLERLGVCLLVGEHVLQHARRRAPGRGMPRVFEHARVPAQQHDRCA